MFILTEKIDHPRRLQILNDVAQDAEQRKWEHDERWLNKILDAIAAIVRSARK